MNAPRIPVEVPARDDMATLATLQAAIANTPLPSQSPRALMTCLAGIVPFALWILPSVTGGIQIAVGILATVMPFLVLLVSLRAEKRGFDRVVLDAVRMVHEAQIETQLARQEVERLAGRSKKTR